ncbi:MAG: protein phosphatase CheZ [Hahellaceae bacterium]|nr:protein phosphatase CheZ [Hahellaceae bacterium]
MTTKKTKKDTSNEFESQLKIQASSLKDLVDAGNFGDALRVISQLNETRDKTLYQEVGRLTRSLHEAIRNFHIDTQSASSKEELSKIDDASDRLGYVVDMTNKAANKTLDLVEVSMPMASKIRDDADAIKADWARFRRREMKPDEFRDLSNRMEVFLEQISTDSNKVYGNLSDILLAQDFQDLTGQVIKRVIGLVKEVEENLVNLVVMAGKVDMMAGVTHEDIEQKDESERGEGPQIHAEQREDVVSGQDDVDDLLSSLGF